MVVAEGTRTEQDYFDGLTRAVRATGVSVVVSSHGVGRDPEQVVANVIRRREKDGDYDEYWAVVDVDDHASMPRAVELAAQEGVALAVSNRCFEIWLLWHFADRTAHVADAKELERVLRKHGVDGKRLPTGFPFHNHPAAVRRAQRAAPDLVPGVPGPNPSSSVWHLVQVITTVGAGRA